MRKVTRSACSVLLLLILFAVVANAQQLLPARVVAVTGKPAPGISGATFGTFYSRPTIGPLGQVAFLASAGPSISSQTTGIWVERGGMLTLHSRVDGNSPVPNYRYYDLSQPIVNAYGWIGFGGGIASGGDLKHILVTEEVEGLRVAARSDSVPGMPGAFMGFAGIQTFNDLSQTAFQATLSGSVTGDSVWFDDGFNLALLARADTQVPGAPAGTTYRSMGSPFLNPSGVVAFSPQTSQSEFVALSNHGGTLTVRARTGSLPGVGQDEIAKSPFVVGINSSGRMAIAAGIYSISTNFFRGSGLWLTDASGGNPQLVLRYEPGDTRATIGASRIFTDRNQVVFIGTDYYQVQGLYVAGNGGLVRLFKRGDAVPGVVGAIFDSFNVLTGNQNGQIAFKASMTGSGITPDNRDAIFATGADNQIRMVARSGDRIEITPGDVRTNLGLFLTAGSSGSDGGLRGFSDRGELVLSAGFRDGTDLRFAIVVLSVGVPLTFPKLVGLEAVQSVQDWNNSIGLIAGKRTIVRAHVENPTSMRFDGRLRGFSGTTELPGSPLVPLNPGGYINIKPAAAARRHLFEDSLNFELPREWIMPGILTLQIDWLDGALECAEAAGPTPNDCRADVGISNGFTPQLKLISVNFTDAGGRRIVLPGLRSALARRLTAAYPAASIDWAGEDTTWDGSVPPVTREVLDSMGYRRILDGCWDVLGCKRIYYGASLGSKIDGIAYRPGSAGAGYVPQSNLAKGRQTHAHEVGHNLGAHHAVSGTLWPLLPNGKKQGNCGEEANADAPDFPHFYVVDGSIRPTLGPFSADSNISVYGFDTDAMRVVNSRKVFDLMSYCHENTLHLWPSEYTYRLLRIALASRFGSPTKPVTLAVPQDYFLIRGWVSSETGQANFSPFGMLYSGSPDPVPPGDYTLRLRDSVGTLQSEVPFDLKIYDEPIGGAFLIAVTPNAAIRRVEVVHGGIVIGSRTASTNAPTITLAAPNGGENISADQYAISWTAADADGDALTYVIQFSRDGGLNWKTLAVDWHSQTYEVARESLQATTNGVIRVAASDGFHVTSDTSNAAFSVVNNAPLALLIAPLDGSLFVGDQMIFFDGEGTDPEDQTVAASSLTWSSSLSGSLGSGTGFSRKASTLPEGQHLITLRATDAQGATATTTATIRIVRQLTSTLADAAAAVEYSQSDAAEGAIVNYRVGATNQGPESLSNITLTFSATQRHPSGSTEPAPVISFEPGAGWACTIANQIISCNGAELPIGQTHTISIRVGPARLGTIVGRTEVSSGTTDPALANNISLITTLVIRAPSGDANGDTVLSIADIFYLVNYLFAGGPSPIGSADVNGDSAVSVVDVIYLISHLFAGGPAPR